MANAARPVTILERTKTKTRRKKVCSVCGGRRFEIVLSGFSPFGYTYESKRCSVCQGTGKR